MGDGSGLDIGSYDVQINGNNIGVSLDSNVGGTRTYSKTLTSSTDVNEIPIYIEVNDLAGNTRTVSTSPVVHYYATPLDPDEAGSLTTALFTQAGLVLYDVSGEKELWADSGDAVSLVIGTTRVLATEEVKFFDDATAITASPAGTYSHVMDGGDSQNAQRFNVNYVDMAGNSWVNDSYSTDTGGYSLNYDSLPPTIGNVEIQFIDSDGGLGILENGGTVYP